MVSELQDALTTLQTGDFQVRWEMVKVLVGWGEAAIAPLIQLLQDGEADLELQWFIVRVLGEFQHPDAVLALVDVLQQSEDEDLRLAVTRALGQMGGEAITALTPLLFEPNTQLQAVQALAQMHQPQVISALIRVADTPNINVRTIALEALGRFQDPRIPPLLQQALQDDSPQVRQVAVTGLSYHHEQIDDLDLVLRLQPLLQDSDPQVGLRTVVALGRLDKDTAISPLLSCLQAPNTRLELKIKAVQALGWSQHPAAHQALRQVLMTTTLDAALIEVIQEIIIVLGRVSEPAVKPEVAQIILDFLHSQHDALAHAKIKQTAITALGQLGEVVARPALIQLLAEPDLVLRLHVIAALKHIDPDLTYPQLQTLAARDNLEPNLAEGIAIALQEW